MIKPWKTLSSRTLVSDPWLILRADACALPNGHVLDPYYVIDRPSWVCIVAITDAGDVILTNEYRHAAGLVALGLPGGIFEPGEDAIAAAKRELMEETGYGCRTWQDIGAFHANWKNHTNRLHIVLGHGAQREGPQALDPGEDIEVVLQGWRSWLDTVTAEPSQAYYVAASLLADRLMARQPEPPNWL